MSSPSPTYIHTQPIISSEIASFLKLASIAATLMLLIILGLIQQAFIFKPRSISANADFTPIATIPYSTVLYPDIGVVLTPYATLPVTVQGSTQDITFTLDSGAIITAIPLAYAQKYGLNTADLKRIILKSLSNDPVFAYMTQADITFADTTLSLPVTFASVNQPVLGRYGFFNNYTLVFDHEQKAITIGRIN